MSVNDWRNRLAAGQWWGDFVLEEDQVAAWRIGPTKIWAQRLKKEWRIARDSGADPLDSSLEARIPADAPFPEDESVHRRFVFNATAEKLNLAPAMPDRPLIVNPDSSLVIPSREAVTVYVSLPLWFRIRVGSPPVELMTGPLVLLSDTWFGPLAGSGDLCYASRTRAKLHLEDLPSTPHRAIAAVRISNHAGEAMDFTRLRLPTAFLSIFADASNQLWTEAVELVREDVGEMAELHVDSRPPSEAMEINRLAGPQQVHAKNTFIRAFSGLLRLGEADDRLARARGRGVIDP